MPHDTTCRPVRCVCVHSKHATQRVSVQRMLLAVTTALTQAIPCVADIHSLNNAVEDQ
jgi:hypothetical protein